MIVNSANIVATKSQTLQQNWVYIDSFFKLSVVANMNKSLDGKASLLLFGGNMHKDSWAQEIFLLQLKMKLSSAVIYRERTI